MTAQRDGLRRVDAKASAQAARTGRKARKGCAKDLRVRKIEGRLRALLVRLCPATEVREIILDLRPLIHEAARDGVEDHDAIWRRWQAEPKMKELVARLTARLAEREGGR